MFGKFTEKYYPDGILQFEGNYKNGQANGYGKSYYQSGNLQYDITARARFTTKPAA